MDENKTKSRHWMGWRWTLLQAALSLGLAELGIYVGGARSDPDWLRLTWICSGIVVGICATAWLFRRYGSPAARI